MSRVGICAITGVSLLGLSSVAFAGEGGWSFSDFHHAHQLGEIGCRIIYGENYPTKEEKGRFKRYCSMIQHPVAALRITEWWKANVPEDQIAEWACSHTPTMVCSAIKQTLLTAEPERDHNLTELQRLWVLHNNDNLTTIQNVPPLAMRGTFSKAVEDLNLPYPRDNIGSDRNSIAGKFYENLLLSRKQLLSNKSDPIDNDEDTIKRRNSSAVPQ
jgi:hypothetical protein